MTSPNAPPRAPGELAEIEAIIRRHVWARYVAACDEPQVLGFGAAAAEIAALRAPQGDGAEAKEWRPELAGTPHLGKDRKGDVTINVPTALCWLQFRPACSTGTDEQTRPGVGFSLVAYPGSHGEWPNGVIPRDEAARLHEMLGQFLDQHSLTKTEGQP